MKMQPDNKLKLCTRLLADVRGGKAMIETPTTKMHEIKDEPPLLAVPVSVLRPMPRTNLVIDALNDVDQD